MDTVEDISPYVTGLIGFAGGALVTAMFGATAPLAKQRLQKIYLFNSNWSLFINYKCLLANNKTFCAALVLKL
jgi:hypothetical protein